jgi:hypothetical protein
MFQDEVPIWSRFPGETRGDKLYDAILEGDDVYAERLKGYYKDDNAANSAIRTALRAHDPRIKEAGEAYYDGDLRTYEKLLKEVANEGYFDEKLIGDAIKAEANDIENKENVDDEDSLEENKDEAYSIYQVSDINVAFENGDTAHAKEIIQDLINTKVSNGKDEKSVKQSLRSSMTSYWKPLYKEAKQRGDSAEMYRIRVILRDSGLYGSVDDIVKTAQDWLKD